MTGRVLTAAAPAVAIATIAWASGGYFPRTWGALLFAEAIALAAWAIAATRVELSRLGVAIVGGLLGLAAWQLVSRGWAVAPDAAVLEAERTLVYAAAALVVLLVVSRPTVDDLVLGVLLGTAVVTVGGLVDHVAGGSRPERLEAPIGYANGAGILAATAMLLALGVALDGHGRRRVVAGVVVALAAAALVLSASRGALVAAVVGLVVLAMLRRRPIGRRGRRMQSMGSWARRGAAAIVVALATSVAVHEVFARDSFPALQQGAPRRLLSTSTGDRAAYWDVAAAMVRHEPLVGEGAGGFERVWLRDRPALIYVRDAHNLYLETLAELGPLGLALLLVALAVPLVALRRAAATAYGAAAGAAYVALVVHAALDWDWELPAVMLPTVLLGAALVMSGSKVVTTPLGRSTRAATIAAAAVLAAVGLVVHLGNSSLNDAHRALDRNDASAARQAALRSRRYAPWAAEPWQLLGDAELLAGHVALGRDHLRRATREDPGSWTAWLDVAVASKGDTRARALATARRLNPLAPEVALVERSEPDHSNG